MAKKILVAGGAGFLGSHLCERLLGEEHTVIAVDNLYTGRQKNLESFSKHPRFTFIQKDICEPLEIEVDQIYNLACAASPVHYQRESLKTLQTCTQGVMNLLELARENQAVFLQASTSEVYGDPHEHPQKESYWGHVNPIGPRACYDEGKRCAETIVMNFHQCYGLNVKIARIFNTYGPRMSPEDGRVVSNFILQALQGEKLTVYGKGEQTRSFCYVSDLIEGLMKLMNSPSSITGPINLGNPQEFTIQALAQKVMLLTDHAEKIDYLPLPQDDPVQRKPDIQLAKSLLEWHPTVELEAGLLETIRYFQTL